jgi:undecaprenyl-diphosphatase|tara:strand:- start:1645 stop:2205 length:561 start_codon:yes stop_codon:yes gene_type:complete
VKKNRLYIIGLILTVISLLIDDQISLFLNFIRNNIFNSISLVINYIDTIIIFILMTLILYFIKKRKEILLMWAAFFTSGVFSLIIKLVIGRARPFITLSLDMIKGIDYNFAIWNSSFLSWHAASLFVVYPFLNNKVKYYWLIFALILAFNRIYTGFHYMSDVIAGIMLGHATAWFFIYINKKFRIL